MSDQTGVKVNLPEDLIKKFQRSSFCPHDAIHGRPETGTAWNTIEIMFDPGSESSYSTTAMFYALHMNTPFADAKTSLAERPWGEMSGKHDGEFIKAVVDWFQSMTQAKRIEVTE